MIQWLRRQPRDHLAGVLGAVVVFSALLVWGLSSASGVGRTGIEQPTSTPVPSGDSTTTTTTVPGGLVSLAGAVAFPTTDSPRLAASALSPTGAFSLSPIAAAE